jgi:acyl-CoA reductase-like NAD-dependent aldehyde dehydrogenase
MSEFAMTIDGQSQRGAEQFGVINPATEEELARAPVCSPEQLNQAVASAQRAFGSWKRDALESYLLKHVINVNRS